MEWFKTRPTDYRWGASGGRFLRPQDMSSEHIVNALNWLERGTPNPNVPNDEQIEQGHFHLRMEIMKRGIRWRDYRDRKLVDGDFAKDKLAALADELIASRPATTLAQVKVGQRFTIGDRTFMKVNPIGVLRSGLNSLGYYNMGDPAFVGPISNTRRCVAVNFQSGEVYLMPSYQSVKPLGADLDPQFPDVGEIVEHRRS